MAISPSLRARMRDVADRIDEATAERQDLVVEAWKAGGGIREIGEAIGMSHVGVSKMLERLGERDRWTLDTPDEDVRRELDGER